MEDILRTWPTGLHYKIEQRMEAAVVRGADKVIAVSECMREGLARRHPSLDRHRLAVVSNGFDEEDYAEPGPVARPEPFTIAFVGTFQSSGNGASGPGGPLRRAWRRCSSLLNYRLDGVDVSTHSPAHFLRAVRQLCQGAPQLAGHIKIVFAGRVREDVRRSIEGSGVSGLVELPGFLPHRDAVALLRRAHLLLFVAESSRSRKRLPDASGKLYEYLATGKPILALVSDGDARDIVSRAGTGFAVDPRDVDGIARTIAHLCEQHRRGGIEVAPDWEFIHQFGRKRLTARLAAAFDQALAAREPEALLSTPKPIGAH
jgi:glycosyltransferase involved in cell wall biosynthesis